ncbi:winged helix-turn-helix domain-containing protein [Flavobacterium silvaticum]|uniref:Response regulator transcription factor n=1 Tax=Flavobacterium silvaticum TaxID=1852020 RepID=A0A972G1P7_9FLAO|nr:winged helix-turn-helix domain-containing protein [Flavobacterium silvaticum]NMH28836.1 response regulator transcription factor [Flavobacterium silvaticum]
MINSRNLMPGKGRYFFGILLLLFISVACAAFSLTDRNDYTVSRREVLLRRLGHEILLQSGDSISRVLPVKKISENEYQIRFEDEFTFQPDSLVNTTRYLLAKDPLSSDYIVQVLNKDGSGIAYGYAISKNNKEDDIISCTGRKQPKAHYVINIKFEPTGINATANGYLLGSLPLLAFVGFIFLRSVKPPKASTGGTLTLGSTLFDIMTRKLIVGGETTELTRTEARVLHIFALSPNEIIERSRLQKEIWEDEGVIVGRSLDMFISKLRKKLELDPNIKIAVIRGKGYRLEIGI